MNIRSKDYINPVLLQLTKSRQAQQLPARRYPNVDERSAAGCRWVWQPTDAMKGQVIMIRPAALSQDCGGTAQVRQEAGAGQQPGLWVAFPFGE